MSPTPNRSVLFLGLCSALLGACATSAGAFGPTAYEQTAFHYQIAYAQPTNQRVLSGEWRLDNLTWDDTSSGWVHKQGPAYRAIREQDKNQDGTISGDERTEEGVYDLKYVNTHDGGVIWTKAHPMLLSRAGQDLDVMLDNYADQLSGEGLYWASTIFSAETLKTRKYVSFVVERTPIQIGPNLGVSAVIELAETERLRLDPSFRSSRLKIVLTKMAFRNPLGTPGPEGAQEETVRCGSSACNQGVALLVIGYYNDASHFGEHLAEFDGFVKRLSVPADGEVPSRWRSRPVKTLTAAAPPPPPAPAAPPPPAAAAP
jgi:hypothetical protein